MATPTRTRHHLAIAGGTADVEVVTTSRARPGPVVFLVGAPAGGLAARAAQRLARAGFTVLTLDTAEPPSIGAIVDLVRSGSLEGVVPSSVGLVVLPGRIPPPISLPGVAVQTPWPEGGEDEALDAVVRTLVAGLT